MKAPRCRSMNAIQCFTSTRNVVQKRLGNSIMACIIAWRKLHPASRSWHWKCVEFLPSNHTHKICMHAIWENLHSVSGVHIHSRRILGEPTNPDKQAHSAHEYNWHYIPPTLEVRYIYTPPRTSYMHIDTCFKIEFIYTLCTRTLESSNTRHLLIPSHCKSKILHPCDFSGSYYGPFTSLGP